MTDRLRLFQFGDRFLHLGQVRVRLGRIRHVRDFAVRPNQKTDAAGSIGARFTDAEGRKWIYRKTPFGVARIPDQPAPAIPAAQSSFEGVKATDAGDSVKFERPGPFGVYRWETRKSDLSDLERAAWDRARQK